MDVRVEAGGGEVTAWRWRAEADVVGGRRRGSAMRGAEEERGALVIILRVFVGLGGFFGVASLVDTCKSVTNRINDSLN